MEEEKKETKFSKFKEKMIRKRDDIVYKYDRLKEKVVLWANENPEQAGQAILGLLSVTIAGGSKIAYDVAKKSAKKKAEKEAECEQYDPRTGLYLYTTRPLTNREKLELTKRMRRGEYKAEILEDMNLL